ncbi:hypothetical protein CcaverHIS002_0304920 [Cutaneotrichosporon cavernicola]|nr:hypothetical protein CcaverHIS002_0304920 [Cutaneotrichosporon cavernicola]BEI98193.1 hypothetical protein CcaverHIS631_0304920 [Cutaneotrichosporon cavernicola]BEJ05969.1 hypothetical protein CcaverHIS641_0304910 [Cutaneotrichosporon cavernicola]
MASNFGSLPQQYAHVPHLAAWLQQQLNDHPPLQNQSQQEWVRWRSNVLKGMSEAVALQAAQNPGMFNQQAQPSSIAPGLYNNMVTQNAYQQQQPTIQQETGFVNMNTIQSKPINMQVNQVHQGQVYGNALAGPSGGVQFSNGTISHPMHLEPQQMHLQPQHMQPQPQHMQPQPQHMQPQPQYQPVASTSTLMWPNPYAPSYQHVAPNAPLAVVDLPGDNSPKSPARDRLLQDEEPSPFDNLGKGHTAQAARPIAVVDTVSRAVAVPRVSPDFIPPRVSSAEVADSSSFYQAPQRPAKRPVSAAASSSKHTWSGPAIPNNPELGSLAPLLTAGSLQRERPGLLFKYFRSRREEDDDTESRPLFKPTPQQLLLVLDALQQGVSNTYLRKLADDEYYTEVLVRWVKLMIADPKTYELGIANMFNILARTNMPVDLIEEFNVKELTAQLRDKSEEAGLQTMPTIERAYNRYFNYVQDDLMRKGRRLSDDDDSSSEDERTAKKRKTAIKPDVKPTMKPMAKPGVKPPTRPGAKPDVKPSVGKPSSMSFFSGPPKTDTKPKIPNLRGMPAIKKRPAPLQTPNAPAGPARPPGGSLLASTMSRLKNGPVSPSPMKDNKPDLRPEPKKEKVNRKGHTVRWVDNAPGYNPAGERPLVAVREFVEAAHELEPAPWRMEEGAAGRSMQDMNRAEGNVMHHRVYDEVEVAMDWAGPAPYDAPEIGLTQPSPEAEAQEARERAILASSYVPGQEPITPDDISVRTVVQDATTIQMNMRRHYPGSPAPADAPPVPTPAAPIAANSVSDLLSKLNLPNLTPAAPTVPVQATPPSSYGYDYNQNQNHGYGYQPTQSSYQSSSFQPQGQSSSYQGQSYQSQSQSQSQNYGSQGSNAQQQGYTPQTSGSRWDQSRAPGFIPQPARPSQGGRGQWGAAGRPGAPYRTRPCKFWLIGDCKQGETCTFLHERR